LDLGVLVQAMQEFIRRANIAHYRKLLATPADEDQRRTLLRLLREEKAKTPPPKEKPDADD
jgi:hypothetical protein